MNRLADALEPYLYANGIRFVRNTPDMTAASSIAQANRLGGFDFYLALHSNAAAPDNSGSVRGVLVFYYPTSAEGKRAADLFAANLKRVYPLPNLVRTVPTTALGEVRQPKYPANLLELGYHDNYTDAAWVENNMDAIARELARSLTEYFGLPFIEPQPVVQGTVSTSGSPLRLRAFPRKEKKKIVVLRRIAQEFASGEAYTEKQVSAVLRDVYPDFATLRRYLIEYGFMTRSADGSRYLRCDDEGGEKP